MDFRDLLPETLRSALRLCPVVSSALFASPPCRVTISVQEAGGISHAHVSKHLSAPKIQSDRTKQLATSRQTCPNTRSSKWVVAIVAGDGCRQTALCRAASCLKRDWNSSPSRLGASTRELSQRGRLTQTFSFLGSSHHGSGSSRTQNRMLLDVAVRPKPTYQNSFAHTSTITSNY